MLRLLVLTPLLLVVLAAPAQAIVNGSPAKGSDFPFLARLGGVGCTATLVSSTTVLTAAHCVEGRTPETIGTVSFEGSRIKREIVSIASDARFVTSSVRRRPGRKVYTERYDAALLSLDAPVKGITPVRLLSDAERKGVKSRAAVTIVGRGAVRDGEIEASPTLRRATLRLLSDAGCAAYWRGTRDPNYAKAYAPSSELCARDPKRPRGRGARNVCAGDSGGPALVRTRSGAVRQAGVVSWVGDRCDEGPVVFTESGVARRLIASPPVAAPMQPEAASTIAGEPRVGATLTCTAPTASPAQASTRYRWSRYSFSRGGERFLVDSGTGAYVVRAEDAGTTLRCRPLLVNPGGFVAAKEGSVRVPSAGTSDAA